MRWIRLHIGVLLLLLPVYCIAQKRIYSEEYDAECRQTIAFWHRHKAEFDSLSNKAGVPSDFLFAIVAPEISQFGILVDKVQTYALKTLYVQKGKDYADFSIGLFQMKPSFVEQLEQYLLSDDDLTALFPEVTLTAISDRDIRIRKIKRLESHNWQMEYLALFCRVIQHRFSKLEFESEREKLRFYANAYNAGFLLDSRELQQCNKAYFPRFSGQKFKYSDISLWFYENLSLTPSQL